MARLIPIHPSYLPPGKTRSLHPCSVFSWQGGRQVIYRFIFHELNWAFLLSRYDGRKSMTKQHALQALAPVNLLFVCVFSYFSVSVGGSCHVPWVLCGSTSCQIGVTFVFRRELAVVRPRGVGSTPSAVPFFTSRPKPPPPMLHRSRCKHTYNMTAIPKAHVVRDWNAVLTRV